MTQQGLGVPPVWAFLRGVGDICPAEYKLRATGPAHRVGKRTFLECTRDWSLPGRVYVLEGAPIVFEMEPCVFADGDEYGDRIYFRRVARNDREKLNAIVDTLISEVETFAEPARVKRPLRWQFFAHRAKELEIVANKQGCACYVSGRGRIAKLCKWAKITIRIYGVGYFRPVLEQYWPVIDVVRIVEEKEPRKGCCLAR